MFIRITSLRRCAAAALLLSAALCAAPLAMAQSAPLPIAQFFDNAEFSAALLSPDARFLAMRMDGPKHRQRLGVVDLSNLSIKVVAEFNDMDVGNVEWVNDHRLVFDSTDKEAAQGDVAFAPGLFAVNRDGTEFKQLVNHRGNFISNSAGRNKLLPWNTYLNRQKGMQDSDYVYVVSPHRDNLGQPDYTNLLRLNTLTGDSEAVRRPGNTRTWLLDHQGQPRLATVIERNLEQIFYLDPATQAWRKLAEFDAFKGGKGAFAPLVFGPDGTLYVSSSAGRDTTAVYRYDLAAGKIGKEPVVALEGYDFSGALLSNKTELLGVRFLSDANSTRWFSSAMQTIQDKVDAALPATVNLLAVAARPATPNILVLSYSDRQPAVYWLFNTETSKFTKVGDTRPKIDAARMATEDLVHYKARDGLSIPAWLTIPNGAARKNLPLVVLVHGGPYVRGGSWGWDPQTQFLASRGYAVLEPEYRGSTGFGVKHFKAGWKQWGLKMQDDIADGVRWAVSQGIVDPKRVCIAGASYGGYATLMGLVNDPDLYRCGIDWVGVTDIGLMYSGHWSFASDLTDEWKHYGMPDLIGDPVKDAAQLAATSPLQQAARIKQPLLLAYGAADQRVPLYHGNKFYDAVKAGNPDVEWVVYQEEGHGWVLPKNRIDFWSRVEKFLARNIGQPAGQP